MMLPQGTVPVAFSDLSSKKFVGEKGALLRLHKGVTQRRTHPHLIVHPNRLVTRPPQRQTRRKAPAQKPSSVHERHYHSQRPAASRRPGTPLGPALLPRSPPRPPPPVVCPPGGGRRRPVASSAVLPLVRPPATVGSNVDLLPRVQGNARGHARRWPPACLRWNPRRLRARI